MAHRLMLRDLLLLEVGVTESAQAAQVRAEIEQNPSYQRVWEMVQRVSAELKPGRRTSDRLTQAGFDVDAQVLAAYLDGTLEKEQRKQLEREAIRTPRLIRELLVHFRAQFSETSDCLVPWSTTEKLFQLGQKLGSGTATTLGSSVSDPVVLAISNTSASETVASESVVSKIAASKIAASKTTATAKPVGIQMARAVRGKASTSKSNRSRNWTVATAAAVTAALCGAIWISGGFGGWLTAPDKAEQFASEDLKPGTQTAVVAERADRFRNDIELNATKSPNNRLQPSAVAGDWVLVALEEPVQGESTGVGAELDPDASVFHLQSSVLEDLVWLKLEGVVALREKGKETWFGPRSSARVFNGWEWQTLSDSWVSARLGKLGEIVLDADSSVAVSVLPQEQTIGLEIQAGRVGLKKLPARSKLKVKYGHQEWNIEVVSGGTALGLDWFDGLPRLAVYGGSVRTEDQVITGRQQLVWTDSPKSGEGARSESMALSPLKDSFVWLDNPAKVNALSEVDQEELLASANIVSSLNRLTANRPASERVLAQYLPAVLSPEVHLLDVLEGSEQNSREEALQWLMGLSPRSPKTRQLWRTIAEKSGAPDHAREFFRLVQLASNSAPVSELDARFLLGGLKHDRLFVREMSQLLLEYGFGNTVRYDATAEPAKRNFAADQWTREILQNYKATVVPNR